MRVREEIRKGYRDRRVTLTNWTHRSSTRILTPSMNTSTLNLVLDVTPVKVWGERVGMVTAVEIRIYKWTDT